MYEKMSEARVPVATVSEPAKPDLKKIALAWAIAAAASWVAVLRTRGKAKTWAPVTMASFAATMLFAACALLPPSALIWRQLRPAARPLGLLDGLLVAGIFAPCLLSAVAELSARQARGEALVVAGTTGVGLLLVVISALSLVRTVIAATALVNDRAWCWEPAAARMVVVGFAAIALLGFQAPRVQRVEIMLPGLAAAGDGYSICMLADLHAGPLVGAAELRRLAKQTLAVGCQAVLLNGDIAEGTVEERAGAMQELLALTAAPDGAYYVPGNHEYYNFQAREGAARAAVAWTSWWHSHGVRSLNNSHVALPGGPDAAPFLALAGVDDMMGFPDLRKALKGTDLPLVLAWHRPETARAAASEGVAVQLSGHTHGGQLWPLHFPVAKGSGGYLSGSYQVNGTKLYVSDGTFGTFATRLRLLSRSEITHVVLRDPSSQAVKKHALRSARLGLVAAKFLLVLGVLATFGHITKACLCRSQSHESLDRTSSAAQSLRTELTSVTV